MLRSLPSGILRLVALMVCGLIAITSFSFSGVDRAEAQKREQTSKKKLKKVSKANIKKIKLREARKAREARKVREARRAKANRIARKQQPAKNNGGFQDRRFAAIVVDVNTGKVLQSAQPDSPRHPASVTKVMTLYMLFEQLEAGNLTLNSRLPVSAFAASQAPSKLGLRAGSSISVEDAIQGLVTRSANDVAVVVAEAIAGSEPRFAQLMTRRARQLGMSRTTFRNASGLPNAEQITTARDLARLGIAIQDRFPKQFRYFSTRSFVYNGRGIPNHNKLLGRVDGVDGIKTGYTRASGFNLLTSVNKDGRRLVAVVLGGRTGRSRDATMASLVGKNLGRAYAGARQTRTYAAAPALGQEVVASAAAQAPARKARPAVVAENASIAPDQRPVAKATRLASAELPPLPMPRPKAIAKPEAAPAQSAEPTMRWIKGPDPITTGSAPAMTAEANTDTPGVARKVVTTAIRIDGNDIVFAPRLVAEAPQTIDAQPATTSREGWIIQIGATDSEAAAKQLLSKAGGLRVVAAAEPFTETVEKNGATLWRARFAGFEERKQAQAACQALKAQRFQCVAVRL